MNKKISLGAAISMIIITAALTLSVSMITSQYSFNRQVRSVTERSKMFTKLTEIDQQARLKFDGEVDEQKLNDGIARGYISGLGDSYAAYMTAAQYKEFIDDIEGKTAGIGVELAEQDGQLFIKSVDKDSPAEANGVQERDVILSINDNPVDDMSLEDAVESFKGESETRVRFVVTRDGSNESFDITRKSIETVSVTGRIIENIGLIKITDFNNATSAQFEDTLDDMLKKAVAALVFDVRGNSGGSLDSVCKVLNPLLPTGPIVYITDKNGDTKPFRASTGADVKLPMVVVMNRDTASAAELFAICLSDNNKAKLVGTQTYGKGVMQETFNLSDGSAIRLTVARIIPPQSPNFDKIGITPDVEINLTPEQRDDINLAPEDDPQIQAALALLK